ncbi:hypothetical protein [Brevundimonas sp. LM2]|uniref:hypothetical protein n=1 Tax=Brevundimonas sp. LM2 TaxID=1938605 RepID=UPI0015C5811C|nr:hypothetical protein [Brevundimonas sp. LM2]
MTGCCWPPPHDQAWREGLQGFSDLAGALAIVYLWKSKLSAVVIMALARLAGGLAFR